MSDSVVELGVNSSSTSEVVPSVNDTGNVGTTSQGEPAAESAMTIYLDDAQYSEICRYMSTQLYVALAIFSAVALCLGVLIAQQVLRRWGVR